MMRTVVLILWVLFWCACVSTQKTQLSAVSQSAAPSGHVFSVSKADTPDKQTPEKQNREKQSSEIATTGTVSHRPVADEWNGEKVRTLRNGARLVLLPDGLSWTVAVQVIAAGGVAEDGALGMPKGGMHLLERMLFQEIGRKEVEQIRALGGEASSYTSLDEMVFTVHVPKTGLELARNFLERLFSADRAMEQAGLLRQAEEIGQERKRALAGAGLAVEKLRGIVFAGHPYGEPLLGEGAVLSRMTEEQLKSLWRKHFSVDRLSVVVSGGFDERFAEKIETLLDSQQNHTDHEKIGGLAKEIETKLGKGTHLSVELWGERDAVLAVGFQTAGIGTGAKEAAAGALLAQILSQRLSRIRGMWEATASHYSGQLAGFCFAQGKTKPDKLEAATRQVAEELARMADSRVEFDGAEVDRGRATLLVQHEKNQTTPLSRGKQAGLLWAAGYSPKEYAQALSVVDGTDAKRVLAGKGRDALSVLWLLPSVGNARADEQAVNAARGRLAGCLPRVSQQKEPTFDEVQNGVWKKKLTRGPVLWIKPDHSVRRVGAAATWRGGLSLEDETTAGTHALLARLWFAGRSANGTVQVDMDAFSVAGEWASAKKDAGKYAGKNSELALRNFLGGLTPPTPADLEFEQKRRELVSVVSQRTDGELLLQRLLRQRLYGGHPYGFSPSVQQIQGLSKKRLLDLARRAYSTHDLTLAVVGDVDPKQVLSQVEAFFAWAEAGQKGSSVEAPLLPALGVPQEHIAHGGTQQAWLGVGFRTPGLKSKRRFALAVLAECLLGVPGPLRRELVDEQGVLLSFEGQLEVHRQGGALFFFGRTTQNKLEAAERAIKLALFRRLETPLSKDEVAAARTRLLSQQMMGQQHRFEAALALSRSGALLQNANGPDDEIEQITAVTSEDVQAVGQDVLQKDQEAVQAIVQAVVPKTHFSVKRKEAAPQKNKRLAHAGTGSLRSSGSFGKHRRIR